MDNFLQTHREFVVSRPVSSSSLTYNRVSRGLFNDFLLLCLTIRGAEESAMRLWNDAEFMAKLRLLDDPIKESRYDTVDQSFVHENLAFYR